GRAFRSRGFQFGRRRGHTGSLLLTVGKWMTRSSRATDGCSAYTSPRPVPARRFAAKPAPPASSISQSAEGSEVRRGIPEPHVSGTLDTAGIRVNSARDVVRIARRPLSQSASLARHSRKRLTIREITMMIRSMLHSIVCAFERRYDYDAT